MMLHRESGSYVVAAEGSYSVIMCCFFPYLFLYFISILVLSHASGTHLRHCVVSKPDRHMLFSLPLLNVLHENMFIVWPKCVSAAISAAPAPPAACIVNKCI